MGLELKRKSFIMLNCKGKKVLFIGFWIFLSALISTAHASRTELVIIRDGNVRSGPGAGNEIIGKVSLGDDYWIQETKGCLLYTSPSPRD